MATRHQVRESIISLLYAKDMGNSSISDFIDEMLEEKKIRNKQKEFALSLYDGICKNVDELDAAVNLHLKEWQIDSIGSIERAILRLGAYEILKSDIDNAVVINEAIELCKKLCNDTSSKFINAVLDSLKKESAWSFVSP